ncbi:glycosomal membrane like protein [Strigomonas culicis]|uniref:Glycosomal membrane like protein n=1 Tax=Strigomonas culicis TaxID=28005 RepID=S9WDB0_9TRYP|nr:glycosomal membrane like protein [Strigomonas culicis]|eukprot:EPY37091.1 glycosomal membrane like protein [Strigomonas culicis]
MTKYIKIATAMSDCRCLMRMCTWLSNIQKISDALESKTVKVRDIIFIFRFLMDGIFSLLDNVTYIGTIFSKNPQFKKIGLISRACLFYGYVGAVALNVYDLANDTNIPNRNAAYLVLTRNTCDLVSCVGNVSNVDLGAFTPSFLGLISAIIASRELFMAAQKKTLAKK